MQQPKALSDGVGNAVQAEHHRIRCDVIGDFARDARLHQDGGTPLISHVSYDTSYSGPTPGSQRTLGVFGEPDQIIDDPAERTDSDGQVTLTLEET
jgi:hypothetical protein